MLRNVIAVLSMLFVLDHAGAAVSVDVPDSAKQGGYLKVIARSDGINIPQSVKIKIGSGVANYPLYGTHVTPEEFTALIPVGLENFGSAELCVSFGKNEICRTMKIAKANFPVSKTYFRVYPLSGAIEKRFNDERKFLDSLYALETPVRFFSEQLRFSYPIRNSMDDSAKGTFGVVRNKYMPASVGNAKVIRWRDYHKGADFKAFTGTEVFAAENGIVVASRELLGSGNTVIIDHGQGLLSLYFHLSKLAVKEGDEVKMGQKIALSGNTGYSQGPHLHFEVRLHKIPVDPFEFLRGVK